MAKQRGSASDPLWFKDALIYEMHVRSFKDSNGDGIGDFPGLIQKLDYLQDLGVTCIWLLPFFPSPLKDDGYDISDYLGIHPMYGTMEDFQTFLKAAHDRGLQVLIELVVNHTSDQHPWFQAARQAPTGSPERDFYVWSDSDQKYSGARIIFTDTEKSNWAWDPVAQAYYWHRFFSHQPDLNFNNPTVVQEVVKVMRYWLDMGVDALRMDAIPYLTEREGTNCENLPETHCVIKNLRGEIDAHYANRILLAEANQWPTDVRPYFGNGDECHMAFHFPLMPRIYMALRQEDRLPITDIIAQTPSIPDSCQWALFLRNHDELTLEMVTSDERDYMYLAYSADPRMRLNLGIRRRLAPLVDNSRRRIELLISLLFSFPGTPILYYGDEIGMGDNIYLGDRNGVRTPMQWNGDRNAGFSSATPGRLYSPVIMDPVWGYEAVNVEAQQSDPSSLLNWMRNMIALRKLFRVFGRGSIEFLEPANRKVLAYLRKYEDEQVLCVANLSRFAQPVDLNLSHLAGMVPIEMLGYVEFPVIGTEPYRLTLSPYGCLWLELHPKTDQAAVSTELTESAAVDFAGGWESVLDGVMRQHFESAYLVQYLPKQRWFAAKTREVKFVHVRDWFALQPSNSALALIELEYENGPANVYLLLLGASFGDAAEELRRASPGAVIAPAVAQGAQGVLFEAAFSDSTCGDLFSLVATGRELVSRRGRVRGIRGLKFDGILGPAELPLAVRRGSLEQSNTSILYADKFILKLFRHAEPGLNPDCEIEEFLTDKVGFDRVPAFAGSLEYHPEDGSPPMTLAMLQGFVTNEGDGWKWTLEELDRYYETVAGVPFPEASAEIPNPLELPEAPPSQLAKDHVGIYLDAAATLGRRTAELHKALASKPDEPAFAPEPLTAADAEQLAADLHLHASNALEFLKDRVPDLPDDVIEIAAAVLSRRRPLLQRLENLGHVTSAAQRIRIHGDYHLGQVLRVKSDFVMIDFEGEPARPLAARRAKQSPLKDVAGMLRSFSYAAYASLGGYTARHPGDVARLERWAQLWERSVSAEFLRSYRQTVGGSEFVPSNAEDFRVLLDIFLLDKVLYEVLYELNSRPAWVRIPLLGIMSLPL